MKVIHRETGIEVNPGDAIITMTGRSLVYDSISSPPSDQGNAGGPFAGRLLVVDENNNRNSWYPFDFGLVIVP